MLVPKVGETYIVKPYTGWDSDSVGCIIEVISVSNNNSIRTIVVNDRPGKKRFPKGTQWNLDYQSYKNTLKLYNQSKLVTMFLEME